VKKARRVGAVQEFKTLLQPTFDIGEVVGRLTKVVGQEFADHWVGSCDASALGQTPCLPKSLLS